jgi:hypothetical protein
MSTAADNPTRNAVDTATPNTVKGDSEIARFQFRATNKPSRSR